MSTVLQFGRQSEQGLPRAIHPDVKAMLANVLVPILVRDYLEVLRREKHVELEAASVTPYVAENTALAEKVAP